MTKCYAFKTPKAPTPERVPRIARLLALAHKFQGMLDRGEVESMAELARLGRVSRARITQIMDLLLLAPEIQEQVLYAGADLGRDLGALPGLQAICRVPHWREQRRRWACGLGGRGVATLNTATDHSAFSTAMVMREFDVRGPRYCKIH